MKAYLLLLGINSCHDADEFIGIYTDIQKLKKAYDQLEQSRGTAYESHLKSKIYEFHLNEMDNVEHNISADELNRLAEEEYLKREAFVKESEERTIMAYVID